MNVTVIDNVLAPKNVQIDGVSQQDVTVDLTKDVQEINVIPSIIVEQVGIVPTQQNAEEINA